MTSAKNQNEVGIELPFMLIHTKIVRHSCSDRWEERVGYLRPYHSKILTSGSVGVHTRPLGPHTMPVFHKFSPIFRVPSIHGPSWSLHMRWNMIMNVVTDALSSSAPASRQLSIQLTLSQ